MRTWLLRLSIVAAVVLAILVLRRTVFAPDPVEVRIAAVERGVVEETITNSRAGTVRARRRAALSPEVGGQVVRLPYREGQQVAAGEIVLELDARSQTAGQTLRQRELEAARAEENRAQIAVERSRRELDRLRRLADESIVSIDLFDAAESAHAAARAAHESARAQTARARAAIELGSAELSKTILRAPFDGIVAEVGVEVGEWTTPSPPGMPIPPVLDILDPASVYISAPMDEVDSARVRAGLTVRVTVDSHRGEELAGQIVRVAPYVQDIQEQNRTVEVEAELDDVALAHTLLPGTSADVEVILETRDDVLRIPTASLIEGGKVFVLSGGRLEERVLETGIRNWNFTEVLDGLSAGEQVVASLDQEGIEDGVEAVAAGDTAETP